MELPQSIAALLLGAMLTDTVIMKSPTTTDFDRDIIARTAEAVGVDPVEYGMSIFKCRSNPAELPVDKLVNADAKEFELSNGNKVYIGQYETVDLKAVLDREPEIREAIKALVAEKGYQFVLFFATDIPACCPARSRSQPPSWPCNRFTPASSRRPQAQSPEPSFVLSRGNSYCTLSCYAHPVAACVSRLAKRLRRIVRAALRIL